MQAQFVNGNTDSVPFHYLIERYIPSHNRNGRPCDRSEDKTTLVFTALVSFKKIEEPGQIVIVKDGEDEGVEKWSHRPAAPVLAIKPEECSSAPDIEKPKWIEWASDDSNQYMQIQHAIDVRKLPHTYATQAEEVASRKMYHFYKSVTKLDDNPNLHLSAHIYASDRNSLFVASRIIGKADSIEQVTSLTHAIVFFPPSSLDNKSVAPADDGWSLMESWTGRSGDGRILYSGRLYDQQGCMIAEFLQDGMAIFSSKL
ncbi:HotDog domain-containing protein [Lipomyces tetrasporus]